MLLDESQFFRALTRFLHYPCIHAQDSCWLGVRLFTAAGLLLLGFGCLRWMKLAIPFFESAIAVLAVGCISIVIYQSFRILKALVTPCSCGTQVKSKNDLLPAALLISFVGGINFLLSNLCASTVLASFSDPVSASIIFGALSFLVPGAVLAVFAISGKAKRYEEKLKQQ